MRIRYKIITIIALVAVLVCSMVVTTLALSYPSSTDEVDTHKWQALEQIILASDEDPYTICVDTNYGINGTYLLTDEVGSTVTTKVQGDTTKKISIDATLPNEYRATDITLAFRDISCIRDPNDILNFYPFNDIYLCFDEYIAPKVTATLTFTLEGYKLNQDGVYVLTSTPFSFTFTFNVTSTSGTVVNNSYACRVRIDEGLNRLTGTRSEWNDYLTNSDGFAIGAIRNTKLSITSVGDGTDALFVGVITTARNKGQNNNNSYSFAKLPNITIPDNNNSYWEGYNVGLAKGYQDGLDEAYNEFSTDGTFQKFFDDGKAEGLADGYELGLDEGYPIGYDDGKEVGKAEGYRNGYNKGLEDADAEGSYQAGYDEGYDKGLLKGSEIPSDVGEFLKDSIGSFLDAELFAGITLGTILLIAITIPLVIWFMKMFAGG